MHIIRCHPGQHKTLLEQHGMAAEVQGSLPMTEAIYINQSLPLGCCYYMSKLNEEHSDLHTYTIIEFFLLACTYEHLVEIDARLTRVS